MKKSIVFLVVFTLLGLLMNLIRFWPDGKLHIFFCDVGQGDAIYLRFPDNSDMLIDTGPKNRRVLDCLSETMPFYDRNIDVVILTHPQADHLGGLADVIKRYGLTYFVTPPVGNTTQGYEELISLVRDKGITVKNLYTGSQLKFGQVLVDVLWPQREWTALKIQNGKCKMENGVCFAPLVESESDIIEVTSQVLDNGVVLGAATSENLNHFSIVAHLSYGTFDALFTGDLDGAIQKIMFQQGVVIEATDDDPIEVFKVPHHGSRTGILETLLDVTLPKLAVILVGRDNRYGHPASEILERLKQRGITIFRTDQDGIVEVISDGRSWQVKKLGSSIHHER